MPVGSEQMTMAQVNARATPPSAFQTRARRRASLATKTEEPICLLPALAVTESLVTRDQDDE